MLVTVASAGTGRLICLLFRFSVAAADRGILFFFFDPAFAGSEAGPGARSASARADNYLKRIKASGFKHGVIKWIKA